MRPEIFQPYDDFIPSIQEVAFELQENFVSADDFLIPVQDIDFGASSEKVGPTDLPDEPILDFFTPIQDLGLEVQENIDQQGSFSDDFFMAIQDITFEKEDSLQADVVGEDPLSEPINPFTGQSVTNRTTYQQLGMPRNPFTMQEIKPVKAKVITEAPAPSESERAAAMQVFKKFYNTVQAAGKAYDELHRQVCTGKDGHILGSTTQVQPPVSDQVIEGRLLQTVMNNPTLYQKLISKEPLSAEAEREIIVIAAQTSDEIMGSEVSDYIIGAVGNLLEYEDFDLGSEDSFRLIADQALSQHIHSASCGHGVQMVQPTTFSAPSFAAFAPAYEVDNHADHNKLVVCENCPHQMIAHVHGDKGPTCPRCRKGPMKISKIRKRS